MDEEFVERSKVWKKNHPDDVPLVFRKATGLFFVSVRKRFRMARDEAGFGIVDNEFARPSSTKPITVIFYRR